MKHSEIIDKLEREMIFFNRKDPMRIHHLIKVHRFAQLIGHMENLDNHTQFLVECAAELYYNVSHWKLI